MKSNIWLFLSRIWLFLVLSGCSTYKTNWECPKAKGIGCSSIEYADSVAKEQIILNKDTSIKRRIWLNTQITMNRNNIRENIFEETEVLR